MGLNVPFQDNSHFKRPSLTPVNPHQGSFQGVFPWHIIDNPQYEYVNILSTSEEEETQIISFILENVLIILL